MRIVEARDWDQFEQELSVAQAVLQNKHSPVIFRGQSNSNFTLQSTLERKHKEPLTFFDYFRAINRIKPSIETLTERIWELPGYEAMRALASDFDGLKSRFKSGWEQMYGYLIYLRHHGFPSPLLDWSASPYVAAYFAFCNAPAESPGAKVSIYAYCEMPKGMKSSGSDEVTLFHLGPYVRTHHRHFRQQSQYTMALNFSDMNGEGYEWSFAAHEDVDQTNAISEQDSIWKINVPASERDKVLTHLDRFNLNAYSLFGTEESLLELLAFRELPR